MSNILIIKHGSLGDIAQASGAIQDIFENHKEDQLYLLTTKPYFELFKKNPFIYEVILDKRLSRFNLIYLYSLMRKLKKLNLIKIYDLQNSSRTKFYKSVLFPKQNFNKWSSSETTLPTNITKEEFDKNSVLERFEHQLKASGLKTLNTMKPDFNWSCINIDEIKKEYALKKFSFIKVYDLQNSVRTNFYRNILFPKSKFDTWSSSESTLPTNIPKAEFDKNPVLYRFN